MSLTENQTEVTLLLHSAQAGDPVAMDEALRQMHAALHRLARAQLRQNSSERTLSATALVSEAYLKVFGGSGAPAWARRGHLLGVAARAMREVLIDAARRRRTAKRPQHVDRMELSDISSSLSTEVDDAALIECMETLEKIVGGAWMDGAEGSHLCSAYFCGPDNHLADRQHQRVLSGVRIAKKEKGRLRGPFR